MTMKATRRAARRATTRTSATSGIARARSRSPVATQLEFLHHTAGNRSVQRLLSGVLLRQPDKGGAKPPKKDEGKKEAAKKVEWSRTLVGDPNFLDGKHASYEVFFNHVLPDVPKGRKQLWQVVENTQEVLTKDCKVEAEHDFRIDIVDIGDRTTIKDQWGWIPADEPCFARQVSSATVGFDDGTSGFEQQTNVNASKSLAQKTLRKMKGPKGTYTGTYTFVKEDLCNKCAEQLEAIQKKRSAPDGEALKIAGVGEWTSEH
jgi:hypothetical protein